MKLHDKFKEIMEKYKGVYEVVSSTQNFKNPFGEIIRQDIPKEIRTLNFVEDDLYQVKGSCGAGRWTLVPWIAIFNKNITTSARKGVYIVYLLNKDKKELYLTLNQGVTNSVYKDKDEFTGVTKFGTPEELLTLQNNAEQIRNALDRLGSEGLSYDDMLETGSAAYDAGCIYYIKYTLAALPADEILSRDLEKFINAYNKYYQYLHGKQIEPIEPKEPNEPDEPKKPTVVKDPPEPPKSNKEILADVKEYIAAKGFSYEDGAIENFYLCLKSKPFVILAGISGTGKTRLVKLFAEAIGANTENGRYKMIPVRPDWSDSSDLLGHVDLNSNFVKGAMTDFIVKAMEDKEHPYFLCLDEMNLARVEYYFSDMLSIIETRDSRDGEIKSDSIYLEKFRDIYLPENLYVIGTVNMDETTFPFSKKVLDRANTIEFSHVDLMPKRRTTKDATSKINVVSNSFTKARYIFLQGCLEEDENFVEGVCEILQEINECLQPASLHFGYRVRDEIIFYLLNNLKEDLMPEDRAMDNEIMQKILPRISGSSAAIKKVLCDLFEYCARDYNAFGSEADEISDKMLKLLNDGEVNITYPNTAYKLMSMMRRYEEDGFTSYWL